MTLPEYIGSRREFDHMSLQQVRRALLDRGWIKEAATLEEIAVAYKEGKRLADLYLS